MRTPNAESDPPRRRPAQSTFRHRCDSVGSYPLSPTEVPTLSTSIHPSVSLVCQAGTVCDGAEPGGPHREHCNRKTQPAPTCDDFSPRAPRAGHSLVSTRAQRQLDSGQRARNELARIPACSGGTPRRAALHALCCTHRSGFDRRRVSSLFGGSGGGAAPEE